MKTLTQIFLALTLLAMLGACASSQVHTSAERPHHIGEAFYRRR